MPEQSAPAPVILALTEVWRRTGGIPAFNKALVDAASHAGVRLTVVSMNDRPVDLGDVDLAEPAVKLCGGRRRTFVWSVAAAVLTKKRPVLVLGHLGLAPLGLALKLFRPRLRYLAVGYGVEAWTRSTWLRRISLRGARRIATVSGYTADRLAECSGIRRDRLFLLRGIVPPGRLNRLERQGRDRSAPSATAVTCGDGPLLLTVGRLDSSERYKGHDRVIRSLPHVMRKHPAVRYVIVGEGDDRPRLASLAEEVGVAASVHFAGFVGEDGLDSWYQACDVFVMPSTGEGFGIVFLEAMLHGKPVIAGNRDGSAEPVDDGRTGILVEPEDIEGLAVAIAGLLDDPARRAELGSAGRERVLREFTMPRFQRDVDRLIAEVIA